MAKCLDLVLLLAVVGLNAEMNFLQPLPAVSRRGLEKFKTAISSRIVHAKMRSHDTDHTSKLVPLNSRDTSRTFPPASSESTANKTTLSLNVHKAVINDVNFITRAFSYNMSTLNGLQNQIANNKIVTTSVADLKTVKERVFSTTNTTRRTDVSAHTRPRANHNSSDKIPDQNNRRNGSTKFTHDGADISFENAIGRYISSPPSFPKDIEPMKLIKQENKEYSRGKCACHGSTCEYGDCYLISVPEDLPTSVTELLLNNNGIRKLSANVFSRYNLLEVLVLSTNSINVADEDSFAGLSRLQYLDLSFTYTKFIENLPEQIFKPLVSLKTLRMISGLYACPSNPLPVDVVLSYLPLLEELFIDNYIDPDDQNGFGPGFRNLSSLRNVLFHCEVCKMFYLWNRTFINLDHISSLDISNCDIEGPNIQEGTFTHFMNIEILDLSHNVQIGMDYLPVIMWELGNSSIRTLKINYIVGAHSLTVVNSSMTQCLPQTLTTLIARGNNILSFDSEAIQTLPNSLKTIDISDNVIFADPEEIPLDDMRELETLVINSDSGECFTDGQVNSGLTALGKLRDQKYRNNIRKSTLGLPIQERKLGTILPWKLKRVRINVKDMHEDFLRHIDDRNSIQELDLSCSYLPVLNFDSFERLPFLGALMAIRSSVRAIVPPFGSEMNFLEILILQENKLNDVVNGDFPRFNYLINLYYLDLSLNQLHSLSNNVFEGLDRLEYLKLNHNSFTHFDVDISNMEQLKVLNLSNTELTHLPSTVRSHIDRLCKVTPIAIRVDMSGCPIQCDCFNLDFLKWMVKSAAFDKNFTDYKCKNPDTSIKYIQDGFQEVIGALNKECARNYPMFLIVLVATSFLLCAVIGSIVYRFRWKLRYLYYAAYLKVMDKHNTENHTFKYDVFISYDSDDRDFVTRHLAPELEKRGLILLIHGRDFVAGTYIASNIVMAVAESRKTLVVLTRNLLESSWCNYELQMATMEAVHTGRQVIVFLLKEDIPSKDLDVQLLRHIRSNTYLPYPNRDEEEDEGVMEKFYDKLVHDLKC